MNLKQMEIMKDRLFSPFKEKGIDLKNRIVMAPMTRSRADQNNPNELMAKYYEQRAGAGLIVTEGTAPSPNGLGYARIPGIYSDEQVKGWRRVTERVHSKDAKIFVQLMHTGRVSHSLNMPSGAEIVAPSAVASNGEMWTDQEGNQPFPVPREMSGNDIEQAVQEHVNAARKAIDAGFDGIELHSANGYLLEQFLNPVTNIRNDEYGGSIKNRTRFVLEVVSAVVEAVGQDRVGIRVSPYGAFGDMPVYDEIDKTYSYLAKQLDNLGILYVHIVDHSSMGAPEVPEVIKQEIRKQFANLVILSGGYDRQRAEQDLAKGLGDLIAFGRPFIANPDLVERLEKDYPIAEADQSTFYTGGEKGYTDYPAYSEKEETSEVSEE